MWLGACCALLSAVRVEWMLSTRAFQAPCDDTCFKDTCVPYYLLDVFWGMVGPLSAVQMERMLSTCDSRFRFLLDAVLVVPMLSTWAF